MNMKRCSTSTHDGNIRKKITKNMSKRCGAGKEEP